MRKNLRLNRLLWLFSILLLFQLDLKESFALEPAFYFFSFTSQTDSIGTEKQYFALLKEADEKTFKDKFELEFLLLLDSEERKSYDSLATLESRKSYMENYWNASNPNPLLPENDWLLEFLRRRSYAKENFRSSRPPYIDDRGRYYFKFGKPKIRYEGMGDMPGDLTIAAHEVWSYEGVQRNFVVYFVKEGIGYREIQDLTDIVVPGTPRNHIGKLWLWSALVKKVRHVSPLLSEAAAKIEFLEEAIEYARTHPSSHSVFAEELNAPHGIIATIDKDVKVEKQKARIAAPSSARDPVVTKNELKFFDQIAQFRGPRGKTRIDVALLVPLKKNLIKKVKKSSKDTLKVEFSGMLRDSNFDPVIKNYAAASFAVNLAAREKLPNAIGRFALLAAPQNAELTLQVEEKEREKTGFYRQPVEIRDFSSKTALLISDIQLNYRVKNDVQKKILPTLQIQGLQVCPYPYREILKKKPPILYFEIYNIKAAGLQDNLQISYTIASTKRKKASVSVSYTRPVTGEHMDELVEIDLKNVKKGWNLLKVSISSTRDSTIKATVQKKLFVTD